MLKGIIYFIMAAVNVLYAMFGAVSQPPADNGIIDINFDAVNGSEKYSTTADFGELLTEPESPEKRGLIFDGWYCGDKKWDFGADAASGDITLTAKWKFNDRFFEKEENAAERTQGTLLRIMSFNILASDLNNKPPVAGRDEGVVSVIERYLPDVVGMQEVNAEWYEALGEKLKNYRFVNWDNNKIGGFVNYSTIAYNSEKLILIEHFQKRYAVSESKNCRNITWALFEDNATKKQFIFISTHWALTEKARIFEAIELAGIVKILENTFGVPVFSVGDYNAKEDRDEYYVFTELSGLKSAKNGAEERGLVCGTWHLGDSTDPWKLGADSFKQGNISTDKSIDHIFASPEAKMLYYDTVADSDALSASDHCPIYADVALY